MMSITFGMVEEIRCPSVTVSVDTDETLVCPLLQAQSLGSGTCECVCVCVCVCGHPVLKAEDRTGTTLNFYSSFLSTERQLGSLFLLFFYTDI